MASLNALAARSRTTVLALILMASPVWGLRPMRALRCALTARPKLGITNLPALPLHSLTASLKSSSKNVATVFLGVPLLSARWATIFDLLIGFAIVFFFSSAKLVRVLRCLPIVRQCTRDTIQTPGVQGKRKQ